jgi:hypothetical protein
MHYLKLKVLFGLKMETRAKNAHLTLILTLDLAQGMDVLLKQCLVEP